MLIEFKWTDECQESYERLKQALASAPILKSPNWEIIFHVYIDASNFAIGCVLAQPGEHKLDYLISFASRQLNDAVSRSPRDGCPIAYLFTLTQMSMRGRDPISACFMRVSISW